MWCSTCNWRVEWVLPEALRLTCSKNSLAIDVIYSLNRSWGIQKLFAYNIFFWHFLPSNYSLTWYCPSAKGSNTLWYGRKLNHNWICIIGRATHNEDNMYNCSDIYNYKSFFSYIIHSSINVNAIFEQLTYLSLIVSIRL